MTAPEDLAERIEALFALPGESLGEEARAAFDELLVELEAGRARAAEPGPDGWRVNGWVKKGILVGFRLGRIVETEPAGPLGLPRQGHAAPAPPRAWRTACGWFPEGPPSARAPSSGPGS